MQNKKRTAFFLLGSNMGDRKAWIGKAIQLMEERIAKIKKNQRCMRPQPGAIPLKKFPKHCRIHRKFKATS